MKGTNRSDAEGMWRRACSYVETLGGRCSLQTIWMRPTRPAMTFVCAFVPDPGKDVVERDTEAFMGLMLSDDMALARVDEGLVLPAATMMMNFERKNVKVTVIGGDEAPYAEWGSYTLGRMPNQPRRERPSKNKRKARRK